MLPHLCGYERTIIYFTEKLSRLITETWSSGQAGERCIFLKHTHTQTHHVAHELSKYPRGPTCASTHCAMTRASVRQPQQITLYASSQTRKFMWRLRFFCFVLVLNTKIRPSGNFGHTRSWSSRQYGFEWRDLPFLSSSEKHKTISHSSVLCSRGTCFATGKCLTLLCDYSLTWVTVPLGAVWKL